MAGKGIDHATCPKARIARSLWTEIEKTFANVLMRAFQKMLTVFRAPTPAKRAAGERKLLRGVDAVAVRRARRLLEVGVAF